IHALHHEQDIWKMGALSKKMPTTSATFVVGAAALCGVPGFSGFFSKDEIIAAALNPRHGSLGLFLLAAGVAMLTTFYMSRLVLERGERSVAGKNRPLGANAAQPVLLRRTLRSNGDQAARHDCGNRRLV